MRPRLIRPSYFVWIVGVLAGIAVYQVYGVPHVIWSYAFRGGEHGFASRHYVTCTFIGPYGAFTVPATDGSCGRIAFFREKETGQ